MKVGWWPERKNTPSMKGAVTPERFPSASCSHTYRLYIKRKIYSLHFATPRLSEYFIPTIILLRCFCCVLADTYYRSKKKCFVCLLLLFSFTFGQFYYSIKFFFSARRRLNKQSFSSLAAGFPLIVRKFISWGFFVASKWFKSCISLGRGRF